MGQIEFELADIGGDPDAAEPTIEFEFILQDLGLDNARSKSNIIEGTVQPNFKVSGSEIQKMRLPMMKVKLPSNRPRLDRIDTLEASGQLSNHALERIEDMRREGQGTIESNFIFEFMFEDSDSNVSKDRVSDRVFISQHDWDSVLDDLGFHDKRVVEIEFTGDPKSKAALENAYAEVERAQRNSNRGDYKGAIQSCRDAIESLEHIDEDLLKAAFDDIKIQSAETQLGTFSSDFLGKFSHSEDKIGMNPPLPRDSDFAIGVTKSFLNYYSKALEDVPST